ncbi:acyl-CoA esterase [Gallibacterium anatis]|uniref:Acyl-CoA esterase n=2 Tax=Gallibacterium anatis TaxID=750 RepID=A0A0A3A860_9PAST|nr:alpha/beta fold hydrolase [Gallibacterium anatis]KGQ27713.1 acyl-CoA esterase [Gallibacterium anatis]KGQ45535.1 acyl-CoA esterase [Gallibacterium anatis]KGQ52569.1 acyl-CoA esterase [Gallibacterium anatis]KGQ61490.1 acyl-CoA esterase [Gallibacterium anatis]KGQ63245.1 acyl-CoA esterase [Gallibacterium anatis 4895]
MTTPLLNFDYQPSANAEADTLVFIHGLFGDMNNLGIIAKAFDQQYALLRIDLRNHGRSFHHDEMDYPLMADDLLRVLQHLGLKKVILIGHSMGGKTAMQFALTYPDYVKSLVVLDIAPVTYTHNEHRTVFQALFAVAEAQSETRQQAKVIMEQFIENPAILQFVLKSFDAKQTQRFRFNTQVLFKRYQQLMDWPENNNVCTLPTLFIRGGNSNYVLPQYRDKIMQLFPNASAFTINGAAHWVHADKPQYVIRAIERHLQQKS